MFMPLVFSVIHVKKRRPPARRLSLVFSNRSFTTDTIMSSVVCPGEEKCFSTGRSACFVTERMCPEYLSPSLGPCSFANVRQSTCTTSNNINNVLSRTHEPLSYCQGSTGDVDLDRWVGMGAGFASSTTTGEGSKRIILRINVGLKITADQGVF